MLVKNHRPASIEAMLIFTLIFMGGVLLGREAGAQVGLQIGRPDYANGLNLNAAGQNILYGVISDQSTAGSFLKFQRAKNGGGFDDIFVIDHQGNITTTGQVLGSNNYWKLNGSNLYASTTSWNVGIGTSSPATKLHVSGGYPGAIAPGSVPTVWVENSGVNYLGLYSPDANNSGLVLGSPSDGFGSAIYWNYNNKILNIGTQSASGILSFGVANSVEAARILANGSIGIGTSTPATKLHIYDAASGPILTMSGLDTNYRGLTIKNASNTEQWFAGNNSSNNFVIRRSGTTDYLTITNNGNVGVGITNPTNKLSVAGTLINSTSTQALKVAWTGGSMINDSTGIYPAILGDATTGGWYAGNYLIGIKGISGRTSRIGSTYSIGVLGQGFYAENHTYTGVGYEGNIFGGFFSTETSWIQGDKHLNNAYGVYIKPITIGSSSFANNVYGLYIDSVTNNGTLAGSKYAIYQGDASMPSYFAANIGIGTTNPVNKLHVLGSSAALNIDDSGNNYADEASQSSLILRGRYWSGSTVDMSYSGARFRLIKNNADGTAGSHLAFDVMNNAGGASVLTERMRIDNSGNVGIGTTNPTSTFVVFSSADPAVNVNNRQISGVPSPVNPDHAVNKLYVDNNFSPIGSTSKWASSSNNIWNLNSANVGIGTSNPAKKLHVVSNNPVRLEGSSNQGIEMLTGPSYYSWLVGAQYNISNALEFTPSTAVGGTTFSNPVMVIRQSGSVGIGTTTPAESSRLDVVGGSAVGRVRVSGAGQGYTQADILLQTSTLDTPTMRGTGIYTQNQGHNVNWYFGNPYNTSDSFVIQRKAATGFLHDVADPAGSGVVNFFTILNNGNVGVSSTSPKAKFAVNGGSGNVIYTGGGQIFGLPAVQTEDTQAVSRKYVHDNFTSTSTIAAGSFWAGSLGGNIYSANSGNVGIGTTSPSASLHLYSTSGDEALMVEADADNNNEDDNPSVILRQDGNLVNALFGIMGTTAQYTNAISNSVFLEAKDSGGGSVLQFVTGGTTIGGTNGTARMTINHGGNVGIGTTNPGTLLDVSGAIRTSNQLISTIANGTAPLAVTSATLVTNLNADKLDGQEGSYYDHRSYNVTNNYLGGGYNGGGTEKPNWAGFGAGKLKLQMLAGSNIGAPDAWYDVLWMSSYTGSDVKGSNALIFSKYNDRVGFARQNYDSATWGTYREFYHTGNANLSSVNWNANNVIAAGNVTAAGQIGVGLTNPSDLLHVHKDQLGFTGIRITNAGSVDTTTRSGIRFGEAAGSDYGEISWYRNGSDELRIENKVSGYGDITFRTGTSLERLRIDQSGNVGINTTSPVAKLAVSNGASNAIYVGGGHIFGLNLSPTTNDQAVPLGYLNSNYFKPGGNSFGANSMFGLNDNYRLDIETNNAARMTIASNGNVGIGTTNPTRLLHVYSSGISQMQVEGSSSMTSIQNGQVTLIFKNSNNTNNNWESLTFQGANGTVASLDVQNIDHTNSYGELNFSTRGVDGFVNRLIVKSNGNIGIGTTNPTVKLEVNGDLKLTGTGKLTANTIDPPYLIEGRKYATYMAGMTGLKEETTGVAILRPSSDRSFYYHVLDIGGAEEGSDLWLFSRTANLKKHGLDSVAVLLAPSFSGRVWYEKDNTNQTITIKATGMKAMRNPEISYRLSAPRFDFAEYGNRRPDSDPYEGLNLDKLLK